MKHEVSRIIALEVMTDFRAKILNEPVPVPDANYVISVIWEEGDSCFGRCFARWQEIEVNRWQNSSVVNTLVHELVHSYQGIPTDKEAEMAADIPYEKRPREKEAWAVAGLAMIRLTFGRPLYEKILSVPHWAWKADEIFYALDTGLICMVPWAGRSLKKLLKRTIEQKRERRQTK